MATARIITSQRLRLSRSAAVTNHQAADDTEQAGTTQVGHETAHLGRGAVLPVARKADWRHEKHELKYDDGRDVVQRYQYSRQLGNGTL